MRKEIKKIGNSQGIILTKENCKLYGTDTPIEIGDVIELTITKHQKGGEKRK